MPALVEETPFRNLEVWPVMTCGRGDEVESAGARMKIERCTAIAASGQPCSAAPRPKRPLDLPHHRQPGRCAERSRREREADLVAIVCAGCGADLGAVLPGAECYCRLCRCWTSSVGVPE